MAEAGATLDLADRTREADHPHSPVVRFGASDPLPLDAGIEPQRIARGKAQHWRMRLVRLAGAVGQIERGAGFGHNGFLA